jgi:outer membrane protein
MIISRKSCNRRSTALLIAVASVAAAGSAHAQTQTQTQAQAQSQNQDHIVLGVGIAATPAYQGSDNTRIIPIPAIDIREGWFFANLRNGIGVIPITSEHFEIGASTVFVQGYRGKDMPEGIDKLSDGVGARLFTNIRAGGLVATLGAVKIVSGGTKGMVADANLSYPISVSSRFMLTPTVGTTWANRKYNDRYFGVTLAEFLASGLPQFGMSSGFKDVSGMLTATYRLTGRITFSATGGVTSMIGNAKDSPLVEKKIQPSGILALTYRL